jgi:CheY-like chemotaxis protein
MKGLGNGIVLLAEDEETDVFLLQRALASAGMNNPLLVMPNGDAVVSYLKECLRPASLEYPFPVLLLLDLKLPRRSGLEVLEWIRSQPALRRLIVIILSASPKQEDVEQAYLLGANSYLVKPLGLAQLTKGIKVFKDYWEVCHLPPQAEAGLSERESNLFGRLQR